MAKKMPKTLQLDLFSVEAFAKPVKHLISPERAGWWFGKIHQVVEDAVDWSKMPPVGSISKQRHVLPTWRSVTLDSDHYSDHLRCSSHYNCRGPYRFRR
jgi:hypothetical protein